jgi:hypothetical protein
MRTPSDFSKAVQRRFEFIEWKVFWDGGVRRESLEQAFGISTPQASVDLRHYQEFEPENLAYDKSAKMYVRAGTFLPRFLKLSADRLLLQIRAFLMGALESKDLWFSTLPPVDAAPDIVRSVEPAALRKILDAIRERQKIAVHYQSLSTSKWREIAPHALAFDGYRWHARSLCCESGEFRDFVLTRIDDFGEAKPADIDASADLEWSTMIEMRLAPHPGLTDDQRRAIECDFGMVDGVRLIQMRLALAYYFIKRHNLDLERLIPEGALRPDRLQIRLENLDQVQEAIAKTRLAAQLMVQARRSE